MYFSHHAVPYAILSTLLLLSNGAAAEHPLRSPRSQPSSRTKARRRGLGGTTKATMSISCGASITTDTTLEYDLECPCGPEGIALTVIGPAKLDMNGFSISCQENLLRNICIDLTGDSPEIFSSKKGATLTKCGTAVRAIFGEGEEEEEGNIRQPTIRGISMVGVGSGVFSRFDETKVIDVDIKDVDRRGIELQRDNNVIQKTTITNAGSDCFIIFGGNSEVSDSVGKNCGNVVRSEFGCLGDCLQFDGIDSPVPFPKNTAKRNRFENCGRLGIFVLDSQGVIKGNRISETGSRGIEFQTCEGDAQECETIIQNNKLLKTSTDSTVEEFFQGGIIVFGNNFDIRKNKVVDIGDSDGIGAFFSESITIESNRILNCQGRGRNIITAENGTDLDAEILSNGIEILGNDNTITSNIISQCDAGIFMDAESNDNVIKANIVIKSVIDDLYDESIDCGTNKWKFNLGGGNQECNNYDAPGFGLFSKNHPW